MTGDCVIPRAFLCREISELHRMGFSPIPVAIKSIYLCHRPLPVPEGPQTFCLSPVAIAMQNSFQVTNVGVLALFSVLGSGGTEVR